MTEEQVQEYLYEVEMLENELEGLENLDLPTIAKLVKKRKQEIRDMLNKKVLK